MPPLGRILAGTGFLGLTCRLPLTYREGMVDFGILGPLEITPPCHGRYLAAHLPGARYFEQPGDHLLWLGDTDAMFGQIREFVGGVGATPGPDAKTDRSSPSPAAPAAG